MRRLAQVFFSMLAISCGSNNDRVGNPPPTLTRTDDPGSAQSEAWGPGTADFATQELIVDVQQLQGTGREGQANLPYCLSVPAGDVALGEGICQASGKTFAILSKHVRWVCSADPEFSRAPVERPAFCSDAQVVHYAFNHPVQFRVVSR